MPNVTITQLPQAGPIQGTESVPIVQNGQTVQTTTAALAGSPIQTQSFVTVFNEPTLNNSRYMSTGTGLSLTDGGSQSYLRMQLSGASGSLEVAGNGLIVKTALGTVTSRSIAVSGAGLTVTNGSGVSGNPTLALDGLVLSLAGVSGTGLLTVTGPGVLTPRSILGTSGQIQVTNGDGIFGSPQIALTNTAVTPGSYNLASITVDAQGRITAASSGTAGAGSVTRIDTGTGLSGGPITSTGTISIDTGVVVTLSDVQTLTNKTISAASNSLSNIPNAALVNSSVTINGSTVSLGGSATITAAVSYPLTISTGLTGGSYDGSAPISIAIDSTVVTLTGSQTLTNKTISGANNTVTNLPNSALTNSSVTINGSSVSLGGSTTVTATASNALTIGSGLSGTSYNGSSPVTIAIDSSVVTLTGSQTLTNKTLTTPVISSISNTGTLTLPTSTDTLVGRATTDTLTNKTISGASNTITNLPNSALTNSSITINGSSVSLGGSATVTATATNALTIGTGLSGTSYNGSSPVTIAIDSTVATLTGTQTLTNKTLTSPTINTPAVSGGSINNTTIGASTPAAGTFTSVTMTTGTITTAPSGGDDIVNKTYADSIASGVNFHAACNYATTADLGSVTYNNGSSGVGATLTKTSPFSTLTIDGHTFVSPGDIGLRVLVKNQSNSAYNGVYTVTAVGSGAAAWQLTRATDYDTSGTGYNEIDAGDLMLVLSGTANANTSWVQQTPLPITVGTTGIVFAQFAAPLVYTAGTGLNESPTYTFNIATTGVSAATYGTASSVPTIAVNAQGQITSASNTSIAIAASQVTSGQLSIARGGTGQTTAAAAFDALAPTTTQGDLIVRGASTNSRLAIGTANYALTSNGTTAAWSQISLTAGVSGTLPIANGGTNGTATPTAGAVAYGTGTAFAFSSAGTASQVLLSGGTGSPTWSNQSALSVGTATTATNVTGGAAGSLVYQTGSGATSTLALGTSTYVLTAGASAPQYTAQSSLSVGSATTATNLAGGAANRIAYQTGAGATGFITAPSVSSTYLQWNGTAFVWSSAGAGTVTSVDVSGGTTGLTTSGGPVTTSGTITLSGTLVASNGGTGQASYAVGDILYASTTSALSKLTIGTNGYVLTSSGTAPQYVAQSTLSVGSATSATNATNTAVTSNSANAPNYLTFVSATTGNLPQLVNSSITCNPSTGAITGGVSGGTF